MTVFYHATRRELLAGILVEGLRPQAHVPRYVPGTRLDREHPPRIYMARTPEVARTMGLILEYERRVEAEWDRLGCPAHFPLDFDPPMRGWDADLVILRVDVPDEVQVEADPGLPHEGFYVSAPISPDRLAVEWPEDLAVGRVIRRGEEGYDEYNSYDLGSCPECMEPLSWAATEDENWWNFGPDDGTFTCPICGARFYIEREGGTDSGFSYSVHAAG